VSRLVVRRRADRDIDEQLVFLARQSHRVAANFLDSVDRTFQRLAESPDRGFRWDDDPSLDRNIRVWFVIGFPNILVFYRPLDQGAEIIRVLHAARDLGALLESEM
jgi:toxin ParE1/3/4